MNNPESPRKDRTFDFRPYFYRQKLTGKSFGSADWKRHLSNPQTGLLKFQRGRRQTHNLLQQKGVSGRRAHRAVMQALDAAAQHERDKFITAQAQKARKLSLAAPKALRRQLTRLRHFTADLPRGSRAVLNGVLRDHDQSAFDSETFASLITSIGATLLNVSPRRRANKAYQVIYKPVFRRMADRNGRSALIDMWETMPAATRQAVEADLRKKRPSRSLTAFLKRLIVQLTRHAPKTEKPQSAMVPFLEQMAEIAAALGFLIGSAHSYSGPYSKDYDEEVIRSAFQRFSMAALQALGNHSPVSKRAVSRCKKTVAI
jgi:hypothetical protein